MSVAIFVSQVLLQIIPYKLTLHFIMHKYTGRYIYPIQCRTKSNEKRNLYTKNFCPKKEKKIDAIWTKIGNILKPNTCYILKSVNSMKLIQIKWTQLVILKGEILFKYLSNQYTIHCVTPAWVIVTSGTLAQVKLNHIYKNYES